jgi:hypothetical protein
VHGHIGVKGNERADRLADMAVVQGGRAKDSTDILNVLMDNKRISEAANYYVSTTMIRLNELHVKKGSGRQQKYARKQRRIVNQHNTRTVSRYTLTDIKRNQQRGKERETCLKLHVK